MNNERYERLMALATARQSRWHKTGSATREAAKSALWISASVRLSDELADEMIAQLEQDIIADAVYYSSAEAGVLA